RDLVNPAKLLELFACAAEDAENLSIERYLVQPSRKRISSVQHLIWARRDTHRPWGAGMLASSRLGCRDGSHPRTGIGSHGYVEFDFPQGLAVGIEYLNPEVTAIRDVDIASSIR